MWKRLKVMASETWAALRGWRQLRAAWKADQEMRRKDREAERPDPARRNEGAEQEEKENHKI